ncbi:hypothetical protein HDA40_003442 [Hamadaea flava]|uniref:Uncharacterized protein n=1 Tax=Hamadaea flava TaxID=1742688 RepID=A0ABV8LKU6_9ACTN|nr:hypothetical protein [Hamadaea flava]MCP2324935.1 hypothetical protein [Hamadaea flava]
MEHSITVDVDQFDEAERIVAGTIALDLRDVATELFEVKDLGYLDAGDLRRLRLALFVLADIIGRRLAE